MNADISVTWNYVLEYLVAVGTMLSARVCHSVCISHICYAGVTWNPSCCCSSWTGP